MAKYSKIIELTGVRYLALMLVIVYAVSLLAPYHWIADLLSHFKIQYAVGGLILGPIMLGIRRFFLFLLCFMIVAASLLETRLNLDNPYRFANRDDKKGFVIAQYNSNIFNKDFKAWLTLENQPDVIILQEATRATAQFVQSLNTLYPYRIQEPRNHAFGMVVLSKYPVKTHSRIELNGPVFQNFALKMTIDYPDFGQNINIYALHTLPPMGRDNYNQRNQELDITARHISQDTAPLKILVGDLNITPYSPKFQALKKSTGLGFQSTGWLLNPTWPARYSFFPLFQIPIDHVLHSDKLEILSKQVGPSFGSDHHILITSLAVRE